MLIKSGVIPDHVLETHVCRVCDRYLTVSPIGVHPEGGNVCGRCQLKSRSLFECDSLPHNGHDLTIPYTLFSYSNHLFPCINRFEGCTELLLFKNISNHELNCKMNKVKCDWCPDYEGTGIQHINHFRNKHPSNFFEKTMSFTIELNEFSSNLVKIDDFLFFVNAIFDKNKGEARVFVKSMKYFKDFFDFTCSIVDENGSIVENYLETRKGWRDVHNIIKIGDFEKGQKVYCQCHFKKVPLAV